jgi:hypothetical protein
MIGACPGQIMFYEPDHVAETLALLAARLREAPGALSRLQA